MWSSRWQWLVRALQRMVRNEKTNAAGKNTTKGQEGQATCQSTGLIPVPTPEKQTARRVGPTTTRSETNAARAPKVAQQSATSSSIANGTPENAHQFERLGNRSSSKPVDPLDIVVGVDFGTSSTKVVIHAPYHTGNPAFAVPFGDLAHESLKYLLPTRLFVGTDGLCSLAPISGASVLTDIKLGLMENPLCSIKPASGTSCDAPASTVATAYLALVLRHARRWFISSKSDIFGKFDLRWSFNLGLPAAIDDRPALREAFDTSGKAAWLVSTRPETITIEAAGQAIADVKHSKQESQCDFSLIPEVIAEVKGYVESRHRNPGLHLLGDVGASTMDVCSFILPSADGDKPLPILTADVDMLGAKRLHQARINGSRQAVVAHAASLLDASDPVSKIPDDAWEYVPPSHQADREIYDEIVGAEIGFGKDCEMFICKTIMDLRKKRDPNSPRWGEKLPVFICGGAKEMQLYRGVVSGAHSRLKKLILSSHGIRQIDLSKPESLEAEVDNESYHRLAVAWGLSHPRFNIRPYSRPSEIENIPPKPKKTDVYAAFISKDDV